MEQVKPKIFIVDDSAPFRKVVKTYLNLSNNYRIVGEASNGQELLDNIVVQNTDIVLMDINMPVLNGLETTKRINREYAKHLKIIVLSQNDDFEYMRSMIEAGVSGYVLKQKMRAQLIQAITNIMEGKTFFPDL